MRKMHFCLVIQHTRFLSVSGLCLEKQNKTEQQKPINKISEGCYPV